MKNLQKYKNQTKNWPTSATMARNAHTTNKPRRRDCNKWTDAPLQKTQSQAPTPNLEPGIGPSPEKGKLGSWYFTRCRMWVFRGFLPFVKLRVLKLGIAQVLQIMSSASVFCSLLIFRGGDMRLSTPLIPLQADTMISCTASSSSHGVGVLRIFNNSSMKIYENLWKYV